MAEGDKHQLEKLKSIFVVDASTYDSSRLSNQLEILVKYAVIDKTGQVMIKNRTLAAKRKILLVLISRFIANKLGEEISAEVTTEEISEMTGVDRLQASARLQDCVMEGSVVRLARGTFQIRPLKIDEILAELEGEL